MPVLKTVLATLSLIAAPVQAQESRPIRPAESQARLKLEEVLSIGSLSGEYDAFGRVAGIALDSRGRILVADRQGAHFKVFDPSGAYLATVGRRGEGPGEFASPSDISVGLADSVFVGDPQRGLISVFSPYYDWVRDVRVSPAWQVNSVIPRQDGTLVVAAFSPGDRYPVKVLGPDGTILRRAGVPIDAPNLYGFEASLLGGRLTQAGSGYVHSTKSPYMLSFLDEQLDPVRACQGPRDLTTDPADVVDASEDGAGIRWGRVPTFRVHRPAWRRHVPQHVPRSRGRLDIAACGNRELRTGSGARGRGVLHAQGGSRGPDRRDAKDGLS